MWIQTVIRHCPEHFNSHPDLRAAAHAVWKTNARSELTYTLLNRYHSLRGHPLSKSGENASISYFSNMYWFDDINAKRIKMVANIVGGTQRLSFFVSVHCQQCFEQMKKFKIKVIIPNKQK